MTRFAFYTTPEVSSPYRLLMPAEALRERGYEVRVSQVFNIADIAHYDLFVFSRSLNWMWMQACVDAGKPIVLDLDDNFHRLPPHHPDHMHFRANGSQRLRALEAGLRLTSLLTVTTPELASFYRPVVTAVAVLPNCWTRSNPAWKALSPPRATINLGWAGTPTHRWDVAMIVGPVTRLLKERPQVKLVIGGDRTVYDFFAHLPVAQRGFVPFLPFDRYPEMLAQFDILLAPLQDNDFNRAKSDVKLMEAGLRRIPWVASPIPAYQRWDAGGLLASTPDEWYERLKLLVDDPALRQYLGQEGYRKALKREIRLQVDHWITAYEGLLRRNGH
ncbi:MAG TPA: glycosyltransferase family 1 protein [Anaerolineae bacterium]|nr:glycosyltransferase family 1 protein [Anaerolineae bacterium]